MAPGFATVARVVVTPLEEGASEVSRARAEGLVPEKPHWAVAVVVETELAPLWGGG